MSQRAGKTDLFSLNEKSSAVRGVLDPVLRWEQNLYTELASVFEEQLGDELVDIRLFGSVARGEEQQDSDVDLLLIVRDNVDIESTEEKGALAAIEAGIRFGLPVASFVVTASEYDKKVKSKRGFWKEIPGSISIYKRAEKEAIS